MFGYVYRIRDSNALPVTLCLAVISTSEMPRVVTAPADDEIEHTYVLQFGVDSASR